MSHPRRCPGLIFGLVLAGLSFAPAPEEKAPARSALAEARYKAAAKQFEEVWAFYRQSRTESFPVYYWSRLILDSQRDLGDGPADRIAAVQGHRDRMLRLETLVKKVRKLGFGFSTDIGATAYYRLEADYWLEREKSR
jgi:hypothetical protein